MMIPIEPTNVASVKTSQSSVPLTSQSRNVANPQTSQFLRLRNRSNPLKRRKCRNALKTRSRPCNFMQIAD